MEKGIALGIINGAFRTVYPLSDYEEFRTERLVRYREGQQKFLQRSLADYQEELVRIVFYSGFRSSTVSKYLELILQQLGDPYKTASYSKDDIARLMADERMIKNERKIEACIKNARTLLEIDRAFGSFNAYLRSFSDKFPEDKKGMLRLLEDLKKRFDFIGPRTGRHFLMNIGFSVVKPDVMVMRVLFRLGLVNGESEEHIDDAVDVCLDMAKRAGVPPSFVDELLVKVGQSEKAKVCRKRKPLCQKCGLQKYCGYRIEAQHR